MSKVAFLVEGYMEQKIIQSLCPGATVQRIGCNGKDVPIAVMAKFIISRFNLFNNRYFPIIILFDREKRSESRSKLQKTLSQILDENGFSGQYIIGIADRTIENWILTNREMLEEQFSKQIDTYDNADGNFGKSELKKIVGSSYHTATKGVELFLKCDPKKMVERSHSFRDFANSARNHCRWLHQ
ncbi:MAG: hypothetical protein RID91_18840 [Azospirillaceae bacterium]